MIKPTEGRVVWYHPVTEKPGDRPRAAMIAYVHSDTCVNLGVLDANGIHHNQTSVRLKQAEDDNTELPYAEWMPYQVGQAAKTEELAKAAGVADNHKTA